MLDSDSPSFTSQRVNREEGMAPAVLQISLHFEHLHLFQKERRLTEQEV